MSAIEVHPPIFPIMQVKQSGAYITHTSWFYYTITRLSDNAVVYTAFANSQQWGANNHPGGSYIQLEPGTYKWNVHNLSKTRVILQPFIMRSDNLNQGDNVAYAGGSNNPKNAICWDQVKGGCSTTLNFEIKEYAPGGTQWYHINCSFWFVNGAGDAYTLDAPNNTAGYYTTEITTVDRGFISGTLKWTNSDQIGSFIASIPNTEKITTSLGDVTNPFYITTTTPPDPGGGGGTVSLPAGKRVLFDAYSLFNKFYNGIDSPLFKRNPFGYRATNGAGTIIHFDKYGEFAAGKKAWYKNGNTALGFIGLPEEVKYDGLVANQLVLRHGDTYGIQMDANIGTIPSIDYLNSKYGVFIQKISSAGDIRVKLRRQTNNLLDVVINDTNPHFYALDFLANGVGNSYLTWLEVFKGNLAFNADNLVSFSFVCEVNYTTSATIPVDVEYRQFDPGVIQFEDCSDPNDFLIGVCFYNVPDYVPGQSFDDVVWLGNLNTAFPLEVDLDEFYIFVKKISTDEIIAILKYPEQTT